MTVPPTSAPVLGTNKPAVNVTVRVQRAVSVTLDKGLTRSLKVRRQFT